MRYNEEIQAMADQCARKDDLFCFAAYIGRCQDFHVLHGDIFVFRPMHEDNIPRNEGFPHYITVLNGEADLHSDSYTMGVRETMHWIPIEKIGQYKAFPTFLKDYLLSDHDGIEHIVTDERV